jgi:hypothetical protein
MSSPPLENRRVVKRFRIECPVTVWIRSRRKEVLPEQGRLCDIGVDGARVSLNRPLRVGTRVVLHVHFANPMQGSTTVRFEGVVGRAEQRFGFEIAVHFRRSGRFVQGGRPPATDFVGRIN